MGVDTAILINVEVRETPTRTKQKGHCTEPMVNNVLFDKSPKNKNSRSQLMLFFINPLSNIVQKLANEKERVKLLENEREFSRLLGLRPVTNSVNEFELYYEKFLGYLIHHLEAAIAEIETDEAVEEKQPEIQQPEVQQPAIPEIPGYTPEAVEAYESLFGEYPPSQPPAVEDTIEAATPTAPVVENDIQPATRKAPEMTQEMYEEIETEILKDRILKAKNKKELDALKAKNPEAVTAIWDELTIPEKNHIKCIAQSIDGRKRPITPGYRFIYTSKNGAEQYVRYIGFYLHGEAITDEDKRAISLDGIGVICSKKDLRPAKKQFVLTEGEIEHLKDMMSNPGKIKAIDTTETEISETPTASEMAENNFTGLVDTPKKSPAGSTTGKTENSQPSKQNAGQITLDLKTSEPQSETETEAKPTEWLLAIEQEINQANTELRFEYESFGGSTYLEVFYGSTRLATLEDDGKSIWMKGSHKLNFHGITDEKIDTMLDPDFLQSPKA